MANAREKLLALGSVILLDNELKVMKGLIARG